MNKDPILTAALADVAHIRSWCTARAITELPYQHKAVAYLAENAEVLAFFISALYDGTNEQERTAIHAANRRLLDYAPIDAAFRGLAESTLHESIQQMSANPLSSVTDDDVKVLLRVLEYVPHIDDARPCDDARRCPIALSESPLHLP